MTSSLVLDLNIPETEQGYVNQITEEHLQTMEAFLNDGDRVSPYVYYRQLTGNEQVMIQAQIASYSGIFGGVAAFGNFFAKLINRDQYTVTLDNFSELMTKGLIDAIKDDIHKGGDGILTDDQIQDINSKIWASFEMEKSFPGQIQRLDQDFLNVALGDLSEGIVISAAATNAGWAYGKYLSEYSSNDNYKIQEDSSYKYAIERETGQIKALWDKNIAVNKIYLEAAPDIKSEVLITRQEIWDYVQANQESGTVFDPDLSPPDFNSLLLRNYSITNLNDDIDLGTALGIVVSSVGETLFGDEIAALRSILNSELFTGLDEKLIQTGALDTSDNRNSSTYSLTSYDSNTGEANTQGFTYRRLEDGTVVYESRRVEWDADGNGTIISDVINLSNPDVPNVSYTADIISDEELEENILRFTSLDGKELSADLSDFFSEQLRHQNPNFHELQAARVGLGLVNGEVETVPSYQVLRDSQGRTVLLGQDSEGRTRNITLVPNSNSIEVTYQYEEGNNAITIVETYDDFLNDSNGKTTDVLIGEARISASQIGSIFGSQIGNFIADDNIFAQVAVGGLLETVGENLAETLALSSSKDLDLSGSLKKGFSDFGRELVNNLTRAGVGAISSFITAEFLDSFGIDNPIVFNATNNVITEIVSHVDDILLGETTFSQVLKQTFEVQSNFNIRNITDVLFNDIGSMIGSSLASRVIDIDSVEGFLGAGIGSSVGSSVGITYFTNKFTALGWAAGPLGALAGAFVGHILGGVIGDLFGDGPPKAFAYIGYDQDTGEFLITHFHTENGGSQESANQIADIALNYLNGLLTSIGGDLTRPVSGGFYGFDGSRLIHNYRAYPDIQTLINQGVLGTLRDLEIAGGNIFLKRALNNSKADTLEVLSGDFAIAADYQRYLEDPEVINALIESEPSSAFTAGWIITLQRAVELGLNRRAASDFFGGWNHFRQEQGRIDGEHGRVIHAVADKVRLFIDKDGERSIEIERSDGTKVKIQDVIGRGTKTEILGSSGNNTIKVNDHDVAVAARVEGGAGNDRIDGGDLGNDLLGGEGDDTIYGGANADWIYGEAGNDKLYAGAADGNALFGGEGHDRLEGGNRSDWLDGGNGNDTLRAGNGDDILTAGAGIDKLQGGRGNDTYILRRGDGYHNTIVDASGLDDVIEFEQGILLDDLDLTRQGNNLILVVRNGHEERPDPQTDERLILQDWFTHTHRIERLRFADGIEYEIGHLQSFIIGTSGDDEIIGTDEGDFIHGNGGDDVIHSLAGEDLVLGGTGFDIIYAGDDADKILGGIGNDILQGEYGNDYITGGYGNDQLFGGFGNDRLSGDRGNDLVVGGAGNDTFIFSRGDGHDKLVDSFALQTEEVWNSLEGYINGYTAEYDRITIGPLNPHPTIRNELSLVRKNEEVVWIFDEGWKEGFFYDANKEKLFRYLLTDSEDADDVGEDTLEFGLNIEIEDVRISRSGNDLILNVEDNPFTSNLNIEDSLRIKGWYSSRARSAVETFAFVDFGTINATQTRFFGGQMSPIVLLAHPKTTG